MYGIRPSLRIVRTKHTHASVHAFKRTTHMLTSRFPHRATPRPQTTRKPPAKRLRAPVRLLNASYMIIHNIVRHRRRHHHQHHRRRYRALWYITVVDRTTKSTNQKRRRHCRRVNVRDIKLTHHISLRNTNNFQSDSARASLAHARIQSIKTYYITTVHCMHTNIYVCVYACTSAAHQRRCSHADTKRIRENDTGSVRRSVGRFRGRRFWVLADRK